MGSEISKKDITRLGFRSSLLQASFNYERMQAGGFTWAMLPLLKKIYKGDKEGLSAAMKDHLEFINTHPNLVGFLMGLLISMEEKGENRSTIKGLKVALFGPIAGIGDNGRRIREATSATLDRGDPASGLIWDVGRLCARKAMCWRVLIDRCIQSRWFMHRIGLPWMAVLLRRLV